MPWDRAIAVTACMATCVAAYGVYLALPLILGALADHYHFDDRQIGWIGSAENAGMLLGSVMVSMRAATGRFRAIVAAGICIAVAADVLTTSLQSFGAFLLVRLIAGTGNGLCYSAGIACLSLTRNSSRQFSVFVVALVLANSLELWLVPVIVDRWGVPGLYLVLAGLFAAPVAIVGSLPSRIGDAAPGGGDPVAPVTSHGQALLLAKLCLLAIAFFNVAASAFWAFSERIGTSIGLSETSVAAILTLCNLFSLTGSILAYWLGRRWGQHRPQLGAILVMILVYAAWAVHLSPVGYALGVLLFFEVWSMASVYQLSTLSGLERSGRYVALVPAAQGVAQSAGPFLAGLMRGWNMSYSHVLLAITLFAVGCFATYAVVFLWLRRADADAAYA